MTQLYEWPPTRSQRARWALEELGIEHSSRLIDLTQGQQDSEAYRAIHPLGAVPALETDRYTIFESVAIVLQLIDEHPEKNLAPGVGTDGGRAQAFHDLVWRRMARTEEARDFADVLADDNAGL